MIKHDVLIAFDNPCFPGILMCTKLNFLIKINVIIKGGNN